MRDKTVRPRSGVRRHRSAGGEPPPPPERWWFRSEALVVIHGHHRVVVAFKCVIKQCVRAQGSDDIDLPAASRPHRRSDGGLLFGAHFAAFASMWVQAAD